MPHSEVWGMEKIMENKVFKLIFGGIAIIIIISMTLLILKNKLIVESEENRTYRF